MNPRLKAIVVDEENYLALKGLGRAGDSYNDVIKKILKKIKEKEVMIE